MKHDRFWYLLEDLFGIIKSLSTSKPFDVFFEARILVMFSLKLFKLFKIFLTLRLCLAYCLISHRLRSCLSSSRFPLPLLWLCRSFTSFSPFFAPRSTFRSLYCRRFTSLFWNGGFFRCLLGNFLLCRFLFCFYIFRRFFALDYLNFSSWLFCLLCRLLLNFILLNTILFLFFLLRFLPLFWCLFMRSTRLENCWFSLYGPWSLRNGLMWLCSRDGGTLFRQNYTLSKGTTIFFFLWFLVLIWIFIAHKRLWLPFGVPLLLLSLSFCQLFINLLLFLRIEISFLNWASLAHFQLPIVLLIFSHDFELRTPKTLAWINIGGLTHRDSQIWHIIGFSSSSSSFEGRFIGLLQLLHQHGLIKWLCQWVRRALLGILGDQRGHIARVLAHVELVFIPIFLLGIRIIFPQR